VRFVLLNLCSVLLIVICAFSFGHCVVCPASICETWLPLWYLQTPFVLLPLTNVVSVLRFADYDDLHGIFKPFLQFKICPTTQPLYYHLVSSIFGKQSSLHILQLIKYIVLLQWNEFTKQLLSIKWHNSLMNWDWNINICYASITMKIVHWQATNK